MPDQNGRLAGGNSLNCRFPDIKRRACQFFWHVVRLLFYICLWHQRFACLPDVCHESGAVKGSGLPLFQLTCRFRWHRYARVVLDMAREYPESGSRQPLNISAISSCPIGSKSSGTLNSPCLSIEAVSESLLAASGAFLHSLTNFRYFSLKEPEWAPLSGATGRRFQTENGRQTFSTK